MIQNPGADRAQCRSYVELRFLCQQEKQLRGRFAGGLGNFCHVIQLRREAGICVALFAKSKERNRGASGLRRKGPQVRIISSMGTA